MSAVGHPLLGDEMYGEKTAEIASNLADLKAEAENLKDHEGQRVGLDAAVAKYVDACKEAEQELDKLAAIRKDILAAAETVGAQVYMPPLSLCGDNAAMIGAQAYYEYLAGNTADMSLNAYATKSILGETI